VRKLLIVLAGLTVLTGEGGRCAYGADNPEPAAPTATVSQGGPGKKITATGTIEPAEMVDVGPQVAGRIASFGADPHAEGKSIDYGSPVEAGTVLAQIDSEIYATRVEQERAGCARAQAELAQAALHLEHAAAQLQRAQGLEKSKAISGPDFDSANFDYKAAKASVTVAQAVLAQNRAALKRAEIELGYTTVTSPIKGVVIARRVNVGQMVAGTLESASLFLVANLDKLQVWASVSEADIVRVHKQQSVHFTVDAYPGKVFEGKVEQIRLNATMTQNVVTYTVVVAISSPTEKLLPYLTANLAFE